MILSDTLTDALPLPLLELKEDVTIDTNTIIKNTNNKKKKKKKRRRRKVVTPEEISASRFVQDWAFPDSIDGNQDSASNGDIKAGRILFELHSHSNCSDGFLSPTALVERAHGKGVRVLALTDHDTMSGVGEATKAGRKLGLRIIPAVEISAFSHVSNEPVHILAYYGKWGPAKFDELETMLSSIREGRHRRAKEILSKLNKLKMPLNFEHISKIAGIGVAPGRVHVARAMVEAGYVDNLKQAFSRYLYDGGPAYATGSEPDAEVVVKLACRTGAVSVLAHPWALKNPNLVVKSLKLAGLHAIEVYRSDGKLSGISDLADSYGLVKVGGSDFHGRIDEPDIGSVHLPIMAIFEFLSLAQPIWSDAFKEVEQDEFSFMGSAKSCFGFSQLEV